MLGPDVNYFIKFILYFLLSIIGISLFYVEINEYNQQKVFNKSLNQYIVNLEGLAKVNNLIFSLQRERGMSTGLKGEKDYLERLNTYIKATNFSIDDVKAADQSDYFKEFATQVENDIRSIRNENQLASKSKESIFKSYSVLITLLLKKVRIVEAEQQFFIRQSNDNNLEALDLYTLLRAIELGGQLRAKVARYITSEDEQVKLIVLREALNLHSQHNSLIKNLFNDQDANIYNNQNKLLIENLINSLSQGKATGKITKFEWWDISTAYLNELIEHSNTIISEMRLSAQKLKTQGEEKTLLALCFAVIGGILCVASICMIIRLLSLSKDKRLNYSTATTIQLIITFVGITSVLFVEHYASQKLLKYQSNIEILRNLNLQAIDNIYTFDQLWQKQKANQMLSALSSIQHQNHLDFNDMDLDEPRDLQFLNSMNLQSIIQSEREAINEGRIISKAIETPANGVIYLIAGLKISQSGLTNTLIVYEVSLNHLIAKAREKIITLENMPRAGYFVEDDLLSFKSLINKNSNQYDKSELLSAYVWDQELNLGSYSYESSKNKNAFLSTIQSKFIWQVSSLFFLFLLILYVSNKSQQKNRKQAILAQDNIKTRQLFMSASEQLASIGSFEVDIETKWVNTSEGFRNLFNLPLDTEFVKIKAILKRFDQTQRNKIINQLKNQNLMQTSELQLTLAERQTRHFNLVSKIRFKESSQTYTLVGVVKETTTQVYESEKQKRIQLELDSARKEALNKMSEAEKERKETQKLLTIKRSTEKLLQEAINAFPASIIMLNSEQEITMKNLYPDPLITSQVNTATFMGVEISKGDNVLNIIKNLPLVEKDELLDMLHSSSAAEEYCCELKCKYLVDSFEYWFEILLKNIATDSGKYTLIYQTNITSNINSAKELQAAKVNAELASEAKSRFLATMSHEIRTPMNGVIGMLDMLGESHLDPEQQHLAHVAKSSALILLRIINDILDFSKIEAGKMQLEYLAFDWLDIIKELAELLAYQANNKKLKLAFYFSSELAIKQLGDPVRLRQILLNLVGNALKFTKTTATLSGLIEVSITPSEQPGFYLIGVKDNGKGMSNQQVDKLFTPFEQADNSIQRQYGGTGLGLSITNKLVGMMQGEIDCQSLEGVGSQFVVKLPLNAQQEVADFPFKLTEIKIAVVGDEDKFETDLNAHLTRLQANCEVIPRELFNAQLVDSQRYDYLIITAESFQQLTTEGKDVFIDGSRCHYILLDNNQDKLPKPSNVNISSLPLYPYYASKVSTHIAQLENIIAKENEDSRSLNSAMSLPSIKEAERLQELILVVEDNVYNQDLFKRQLATLGFQCVIADNGKIALQLLEQFDFALIISDCHMPVMDGYEFTKQRRIIEKQNNLPALPIIAATANALDGEEQICLACGMNDYLAKPILLQELNKKLKRWLNGKSTQPIEKEDQASQISKLQTESRNKAPFIQLDVLENYVGTDKSLQKLFLEKFVSDSEKLINQLNLDEPNNIKDIAHQLKTSAKTVGSNQLADTLQELEEVSQKGSLQEIEMLIKQCKMLFRSAQDEITSILINTD